jgi:hypothetical protein
MSLKRSFTFTIFPTVFLFALLILFMRVICLAHLTAQEGLCQVTSQPSRVFVKQHNLMGVHETYFTYCQTGRNGLRTAWDFFLYILCPENKYNIVRRRVTYKTGFGLYDWIYCTLYIHTQLRTTTQYCRTLLYNHIARTTQKTVYIVDEACLPCRCLAIDVLLPRALAPSGMCSPSRCLVMGIHVTICLKWEVLVSRLVSNTAG